METFFKNFFTHLYQLFLPRYLWVHVVAILGTYLIVMSGFDWWYFVTLDIGELYRYLFPGLLLGMFLPLVIPSLLVVISAISHRTSFKTIGLALLESAVVGWLLSAAYKAFTGRIQPPQNALVDTSHGFNFGFMRHGIFWGWPSSHTVVAFATMTTLYFLVPKRYTWLGVIGLLYALYVGIAVSIQIHWFSEFFAGALFGSLVGVVVSKSYRNKKAKDASLAG